MHLHVLQMYGFQLYMCEVKTHNCLRQAIQTINIHAVSVGLGLNVNTLPHIYNLIITHNKSL